MKQDNIPELAQYWNKTAQEFDSIYTGANKGIVARFLDRRFRGVIFSRFEWVMQTAGDVVGKSICDVGCGPGRFVAEFAKRRAKRVTGVDIAPAMLRLARELAIQCGVVSQTELVNADILDWQTDDKYEITLAIGLFDYIAYPSERLRVIRKLTTEKFLSVWPRLWTWRMPLRKIRLTYIRGCPVYFYRKSQVYKLLEDAGFKVERCDRLGTLFCVEAVPK